MKYQLCVLSSTGAVYLPIYAFALKPHHRLHTKFLDGGLLLGGEYQKYELI